MEETLNKNKNEDELDLDVSDEIVVKDEKGNYRVLIGGRLEDLPAGFTVAEKGAVESSADLFTEEGLVSKEKFAEQLMPPLPAIWQKQSGAAFYFHPEDEEDVNKIVSEKGLDDQIDLSPAAEEIVTLSGVRFASENNRNKVKNIILSRLKHVREQAETRDVLTRAMTEGGTGLSDSEADILMSLVVEKMQQIESGKYTPPTRSELDNLIRQSDDTYQFDQSPAGLHDTFAENLAQIKPEFTKTPHFKEPEIKSEPDVAPPRTKRPVSTDIKTRVSDVRPMERVRGPIEELRYMNLAELHRIGTNALDNISRIKDKIDALEEESFNKKVEGIKAWRQSPLYNLYLDIGRQSMEQGKSISQVIMERQQLDSETLSMQEFEKISDLNQELRF